MAMKAKQPAPLTEKLTFRMSGNTMDADRALSGM